ncbi:hypothetical protein HWV62_26210 [Athelia sp. TMB]|nr:hypothetical protein HWV62_26210 [Athelia sp. TMB]
MSMPIVFGPGGGFSQKQEQIERMYRMIAPWDGGNLFMIIREQTSFDLDKKIWDSGIALSSWILDLYAGSAAMSCPKARTTLFSPDKRNILELGAGTGIVALTIGTLRSTSEAQKYSGSIITTDLASAMPLLEHNISANADLFAAPGSGSGAMYGCKPRAAVLDWEEDLPDDIRTLDGGIDAIVMADVTYNTASFPALIKTLDSLRQLNVDQNILPPIVVLGYKERDPEERSLWVAAHEIGLELERVGERRGCGGQEVEVWLGGWAILS